MLKTDDRRGAGGRRPAKRAFILPLLVLSVNFGASEAKADNRLALVMGESAYATVPPLSVCSFSARAVAASLRRHDYDVIEIEDASNGMVSAAMDDMASRLAAAPDSTVLIYACAYSVSLGDRLFILPVESVLQRSSDALTEGIIARSLRVLSSGATNGLVVLDATAWPGEGVDPPNVTAMAAEPIDYGQSLLAVVETGRSPSTTTLAADALIAALAAPGSDVNVLAETMRETLAAQHDITVVAQITPLTLPTIPFTPVAPPAPPVPPPPPAPAAALPRPPARVVAIHRAPPPPRESAGALEERKLIQRALAQLGYYDYKIDGVYGANTRAAMRRYQQELGQPETGDLTADQLTQLVHVQR